MSGSYVENSAKSGVSRPSSGSGLLSTGPCSLDPRLHMDDDDHYFDGPGDEPEERMFEDGTWVAADDPLPPGIAFSRVVEEAEYNEDGDVESVARYIETTRVTPDL